MTLQTIKTAVVSRLREKTEIPVYAMEVMEGCEFPSFCVACLPKSRGKKSVFWQEKQVEVIIIYYPKNIERAPEYLELMGIADKFDSIFETNIKVEDRYLEIFDASWSKVENTLEYSFNLNFLDSVDSLDTPNNDMEYFNELVLEM